MNNNLLVGMQWHGFATMPLLRAAVEERLENREWITGNDGIAMLLNHQPFLNQPFEDSTYNTDMGIKLLRLQDFQQMRAQAGGDDQWENYQSGCHRYGPNPRRLDMRYGVMKPQGNQVQDRESVWLEFFEVKGDLRCRRRMVFPPAVAQAIGAEPLVLLQYKRWPFCHPAAHRSALLHTVEEIEAAEAAAAAAGGNNAAAGVIGAAEAAAAAGGVGAADGAGAAAGDIGAADGEGLAAGEN